MDSRLTDDVNLSYFDYKTFKVLCFESKPKDHLRRNDTQRGNLLKSPFKVSPLRLHQGETLKN